jgi:MFS family permease
VAGDLVYFLALSWAVVRLAGPAQVGAVLAVGAVPRAVLMLAGGVIADRFGPRRVVIGSDLLRCALVLGAAVLIFVTDTRLWMLFTLALVFGVIDALFMPAVGAMPPRITHPDQLGRVQGMRTLAVRVSNAVGPLVAAVVLTAAGASGGLATAGLLFGLSVLLLLAVRVRSTPTREGERTTWDDFRDGLRYLQRNRHLIRLVLIIGACELCFSGPIAIGLVLLADERQWSAAVLGSILTTFSIGGAAAAILLIVMNRIPRAGLTLICSLLLTAVLLTWIGRSVDPGTATAVSAALGLISGVAMTVGNALLQKQTDERYLGRVSSVLALCTFGLGPLVYPLVGLTAAAGGTAIFFAACGLIWLLAALISAASPTIRCAVL